MKKSSVLIIAAALILSSCGSVAQYATSDNGQRFKDGIYSNTPAFRTKTEKDEAKSDTQALIEKTKSSMIYLFGDKKDTVMIPQDMSAMIRYDQKLGGTVVTVDENPYDWRYDLENNYGYYYEPYSIGASWYWSRHFSPWYTWSFTPWRYGGWYDPWYYGSWYGGYWGWYDPWYYGSWYGSYWGWYDPWYYPYHPHHGWYDPYWGHIHGPGYWPGGPGQHQHKDIWQGSRYETGSDRVFAGSTSLRGGIGSRSTVSRNSTIASSTTTRTQSSAGRSVPNRVTTIRGTDTKGAPTGRSTVVRTTPAIRDNATAASRPSGSLNRAGSATASRPATTIGSAGTAAGRPSGTITRTPSQTNYRRPAGAATTGGTINGRDAVRSSSDYNNAGSATRSSSYERSSSSYNRSTSTSSRSSVSTGGGGFSRSSSGGGGGGYSRSGGSTGGRR